MYFMSQCVTLHHQPLSTAADMVPALGLYTTNILALIYRFQPLFRRCIQFGINNTAITTVAELTMVTLATIRTINSNHWWFLSVQLGVRACATLIDIDAALKTIQCVVGNHLMWTIIGDQIGKVPAGSRTCLETAIIPARVQIEV